MLIVELVRYMSELSLPVAIVTGSILNDSFQQPQLGRFIKCGDICTKMPMFAHYTRIVTSCVKMLSFSHNTRVGPKSLHISITSLTQTGVLCVMVKTRYRLWIKCLTGVKNPIK